MGKLIANECANYRRPIGYVIEGTLQLPTLCVLCCGDKETLKEWGHRIDKREKPIQQILTDYRATLNHMDLKQRK